jgi:colanic acid/amylovoran biosynthesis protein
MQRAHTTENFLLVGNASYQNRGCEAIVRGTVDIVSSVFSSPDQLHFTSAFYGDRQSYGRQAAQETDARISHLRLDASPIRFQRSWWEARLNRHLGMNFPSVNRPLVPAAREAVCALEVGGDNYTLDYGFPEHLLRMDRWLQSKSVPVVIWGASIGPFTETPDLERAMMEHLRSLKAVFVRETATYDYLTGDHKLPNVHLFADPAFVMEPLPPADQRVRAKVTEQPIALNISPLISAYTGKVRKMPWETKQGDLLQHVRASAEIAVALRRETGLPVLLVPHVQSPYAGIDDYAFLRSVQQACGELGQGDVEIVDEDLGARELKWLLARCRLIIAARTHATIAGFSTAVPTISLGYSRKALGINRDVFGSEDYLIMARDLTPSTVVEKAGQALASENGIKAHLTSRSEELRQSAFAAGEKLAEILRG